MATAQEYADWVEGHLWNRWGSLDFEFPDSKAATQGIYVITKDIDLPKLSATQGLKIIVPQGVKVNVTGDIGDNEVFFMEDYSAKMSKNHKLSIYSDVLDALDPLGYCVESFLYAKPAAKEDFNKAVVRPATARALDNIHGGLKEDLTFKPMYLKPKLPQS